MKPKLRPLEISPIEQDGQDYFYFHDRLGFAQGAAVPGVWGTLLSFFDGTRDIEAIVSAYENKHGEQLTPETVERIIERLDEAHFMDSPRFQEFLEGVISEFENASTRPAALAGASYPASPAALRKMLDDFFKAAAKIKTQPLFADAKVRGIVVPHIDFNRGGATEALAYQQLKNKKFDILVVLGIAHSGVDYPFCAASKDFETPLGTAKCDREFLEALNARVDGKMLNEQYAHKNEHSIEFVAVFLQHLENLKSAKIVPILCGGFFEALRIKKSPQSTPVIADFIKALRETTLEFEAKGQSVGFIASVDLAHVGSRFGSDEVLTLAHLNEIETEDSQFLEAVEAGDAEKAHRALAKNNNARHVDAHPAVYTFLSAFPELRAQLLEYQQAFDANENSVVSFASMTLYEEC